MTELTTEQLLAKVIDWIKQVQGIEVEIRPDTPILADSLLDSMNLLLMISHFEEQLGVSVDENALIPENFETPERIAGFLQASIKGAAA